MKKMISVDTTIYNSPIGTLQISSHNGTLTSIKLANTPAKFRPQSGNKMSPQNKAVLELAAAAIDNYFNKSCIRNKSVAAKLNLLLKKSMAAQGTEFQRRVWAEMLKIPLGETRSYKKLAEKIGNPNAQRAIGSACNKNPFLILVPCHRVVATSGIGGFAHALSKKQFLLQHETVHG